VEPDGKADGDGSLERPLDLATALGATSPAQPCDTVWLRGGEYQGPFVSVVKGRAGAPIIFRQFPGERVTLAGSATPETTLMVNGDWSWFWGFEVTNLDPNRTSTQPGPWPGDLRRGTGVASRASHVKFINLVVHDAARGFEVGAESIGTEIYGSLIYNNGWEGPDGAPNGNGIETQNASGVRRLADNVIFNQFSNGISAYTGQLDHIELDGNIVFGNGSLSRQGVANSRNILLGGGQVAKSPVLKDNITYLGQANVGYGAGCADATLTDNYFAAPLVLVRCTPQVKENEFYDPDNGGFANLSAAYPSNTFHARRPTGTVVRVRRNQYEPGRATIGVFNWDRADEVSIDLAAAGLANGDRYEVRDAQNIFGKPLATGTSNGPVTVPTSGLTMATPVGTVPVAPKHTAPEFVIFVVLKQATPKT
jgi:hypothetical protein